MRRYRNLVWVVLASTILGLAFFGAPGFDARADNKLRIGSKNFTEGYLLSEMLAQLLESEGYTVERKFGLGGTLVCYEALVKGEIDAYPEYSGTLEQAILKLPGPLSYGALQRRLREDTPLELLETFGFNNTYAVAVQRSLARSLELETIGDLAGRPGLRLAFSHEFINRKDGWPGLARTYGLTQRPSGIEHGLAYQAVAEGKIDVTDVYSTDGDIQKYDLTLLEDEKSYFPVYMAAPLVRADVDPEVKTVLARLAGRIDEAQMRALNARVLLEGRTFTEVAEAFLASEGILAVREPAKARQNRQNRQGRWPALLRRTVTHLKLTLIALVASILVAVPAGVLVYRARRGARVVIYVAGALQTIPSIALLAFMIPLLGIGMTPAVVALFLYALLPILRNTATALFAIDPVLKKVAVGMGLTLWQRLRYVELPLASPTILAGVKTAAVINIGTATLAAFIGAGGLGEPIVTGLALNDTSLILEGAIPAAVLAILTELFFEAVERLAVPRHLLQKADA